MKSRKILEGLDKKYIWHPFTQMKEWQAESPPIIDRGEGSYLIDIEGRRYLDGVSSLWCNVHGHRQSQVDQALKKQLGKIAHSTFLGLTHTPAIELSEQLIKIAPKGLSRVFYSDSGSSAVEVALKMAFQYWQHKGKPKKVTFLKLKNAYHGDTLGSMSVGGIDLFHEIFHPLFFKAYEAQAPYAYRDNFKGTEERYAAFCAAKVEAVLKKHHEKICAIVMEPLMQGAAGMLKHPKGYLARLRRLATRYGVLLIVDEVATGFGRTGKMFACEHEKVTPDLLCVAKGLTAGYLPLSATLATEEIYKAFLGDFGEYKTFFHGHTYSANPLACAAAIANLEVFKNQKVLQNLQKKIQFLASELRAIANLPHVGEVRQVGFMVGIELVQDLEKRTPYDGADRRAWKVAELARKQGILIRPLGNVVVLMPPLSITEKELHFLCSVLMDCIEEATH